MPARVPHTHGTSDLEEFAALFPLLSPRVPTDERPRTPFRQKREVIGIGEYSVVVPSAMLSRRLSVPAQQTDAANAKWADSGKKVVHILAPYSLNRC